MGKIVKLVMFIAVVFIMYRPLNVEASNGDVGWVYVKSAIDSHYETDHWVEQYMYYTTKDSYVFDDWCICQLKNGPVIN